VQLRIIAEGHALSYQWVKDGILLPSQNLSELILNDVNSNHAGIYSIDVKGTCGNCRSDSIYLYVSFTEDPDELDVYIWPTISTGIFNIASNLNGSCDMIIYNIAGQIIEKMENLRYREFIDLSGKEQGMYLVHFISIDWSKTLIILKE
jgi:hypothetical protein